MTQAPYVEPNRAHWDRKADDYQACQRDLLAQAPEAWGMLRVPDSTLGVLGDVVGQDVLEYGCGAAQWSVALARRGARPVALDISERQLAHARREMEAAGVDFPLVHAPGEEVPLPDASFDVVLSDGGVFSWTDPALTLPEAARLLRPGGRLAFAVPSAFAWCHWAESEDFPSQRLVRPYFGLGLRPLPDGAARFTTTHGDWVRLLVTNGFELEALHELQPEESAHPTYYGTSEWTHQWPLEEVWVARRRG